MSLKVYRLYLCLVGMGCVSGCGQLLMRGNEIQLRPLAERRLAPDASIRDTNGVQFKMSNYRGKVVLVTFWGTVCQACEMERPILIELQRIYSERGFAVVGISVDASGAEVVVPYVANRQIGFRVGLGDARLIEKFGGLIGIPTELLIDRDGRIAGSVSGSVSKRQYEEAISKLL